MIVEKNKKIPSIPFRSTIAKKLGSINAALYLQQIIYWSYISGKSKPFFKFRSPCNHYVYLDGDSFEEELFMSAKAQRKAFESFGWSNKSSKNILSKEKAMILLQVDGNKLPWYSINKEVLETFLNDCIDNPNDLREPGQLPSGNIPTVSRESINCPEGFGSTDLKSSVSIQETNITETKQENSSTHTLRDNESEQPSLSSSSETDKEVEKVGAKKKVEYSVEFNLVWTTYNPPVPTAKGRKINAAKAHTKAREILSNEEIMNALSLYMSDEFAFGRSPCHLSTFLNGIITNTKYRDSYIDKRYDKVVQRQEGAYGKGKTAMDFYEADLTLQGPLGREELIGRTDELDFNMSIMYPDEWTSAFIDNNPRESWVPFLGDGYIAFQIKKSKNGDFKRNVLFTIEELRNNLYVHYHGYVWTEKFEDHYKQINAKIKASLPAPDKKDSNIIEVEEIALDDKNNFTEEELFE